jgi:hypothetical protein
MDDVSDLAPLTTSQPEEAAKNISNANLFSVDPRFAADNKSTFDQKAQVFDKPLKAEPPVADYMRQSSEHAALVSKDTDHLNYMARQAKMIGDYVFDRPTTQQKIVDLTLKKINQDGKLSSDDEIKLLSANADAQDLQKRDYGLNGPIEKIPAEIAGGLSELGQSVVRGARKGLMEGPFSFMGPRLLAKHPMLAGISLGYGIQVKEPYDNLTAGTYNELSSLTDENGQPKNLDHETKLAISRGVGVVGTVLMNGAGLAVAEASPFLRNFMNPSLVGKMISTPGRAAILSAIGGVLKSSAAVGGASALTEVTKIIGEEMAQNSGTDEAGFWNALASASSKLGKYAPRVAQAGSEGMLLGGAIALPLEIAGFGRTRQHFRSGYEEYLRNRPEVRDVTPEALKQLPGTAPAPESVIDITPNEPGGGSPIEKSFKSIQLNEALHNINDVQKGTTVGEIAPGELNEINKRGFVAAGMDKLYTNVESLKEWATSEEKGDAIRRFIDPKGLTAGRMNAPVEISSHDVIEIAKKYPDIIDHMQPTPDSPTGLQAKEYVESLNRAEEKRTEIMTKLGIKPEEVQPKSNVIQLPGKPQEEEPPPFDIERAAIRTQSLLDAKKHALAEIDSLGDTDSKRTKTLQKSVDNIDQEIASMREDMQKRLGQNPPGSVLAFPFDEKAAANKAELQFGREPTFSDALRTVLPEEQVAKFDQSVLRARTNTVDLVRDASVHEMNGVIDQTSEIAKADARRAELERIAHDPNYAIVDKFHAYQIANKKGKAKRSIYAIDPSTLPNDLTHFLDNPQLKAHKVFVKGGETADDSARALGFTTAKEMLDTLSKTPTREQIIKARSEFYDSHIEQMAKAGVDLDHTSILKAFTDKTKAYLETMKYLKDTDWSSTKFGIKKIALPLPRIEEVENDAREFTKGLKVKSLTPAQWVVGERQSYRQAVNKFLAGDIAGAFEAKEQAARNAATQKEVRKATAQINRIQKFARRLEEPAAQEILRKAGKLYQAAMDELLDAFNLNPRRKNQAQIEQYQKWVKRQIENGRGDFSIPDHLSDIRQSIDEMTVEQVLVAGDRMRAVFKQAQLKNELIESKELRDSERSMERIEANVMNHLADHPGNDKWNFPDPTNNEQGFQYIHQKMQDLETTFTNMEHIIRYYDRGQHSGLMQELLFHQSKGDGKFQDKEGTSWMILQNRSLAKKFRETFENHGSFDKIEKNLLSIPEFEGFPNLGNGRLTKGDLLRLWQYKGDPDGRQHITTGFRNADGKALPIETIQKVLDRELTEADVTAAQYHVDIGNSYWERSRDLQIETKGEEPVQIKGVPNEHNGKSYPGGRVRLLYQEDFTQLSLEKQLADLKSKDIGKIRSINPVSDQTEQGRLISRVDNTKPLDLSYIRGMRAIEEDVHDIAFRKATTNALTILENPKIKSSMIESGGEARYNYLVNGFQEIATRAQATNANFFLDQNNLIKRMFSRFQGNFSAGVLGLSASTTMVQFEELSQLMQNMGPKGIPHFSATMAYVTSHPHLWGAMLQESIRLDPTIGSVVEHIQNQVSSMIFQIGPNKEKLPFLSPMKDANDWMVRKMMAPVSLAEITDKVVGSLAAYRQFMSGHADNWPMEKVQALNPTERDQQATAYVRQVSRLSFMHTQPEDKSVFQKHPAAQPFAFFWNYFRNVLNNQISEYRQAKWAGKAGTRLLGESGKGGLFGEGGNAKDAAGSFTTAAGLVAFSVIMASIGRWYAAKVRGKDETPDDWDWKGITNPQGRQELLDKTANYMFTSPVEQFFTSVPGVRDIYHAEEQPDRIIRGKVDKEKDVNLPITRAMTDLATGAHTIHDSWNQAETMSEFFQYLTNLDNKETGALLRDTSYFFPWPVNAYSKLMRSLDIPLNSPTEVPKAALDALDDNLGNFLDRQKGPKALQIDGKFVSEAEAIKKSIAPKTVQIPNDMTDTMKFAMSGADWSKPDGIYGFTPDQWREVQKSAPDLGLTSAGRISKDTTQQEKAMDWFLHEAGQNLAQRDIEVNGKSLYGAFKLGVDKYEALAKAPNDAKVKTVLGQETLMKNPDLLEFKTVGQVKNYLSNQYNKAHEATRPISAKLTPPTANAED